MAIKRKSKSSRMGEEELEAEIEAIEDSTNSSQIQNECKIEASKPISQIKKGEYVTIDGTKMEVDAQYTLIDHGSTKEIAIELFNPKTDEEYQLRYFNDQAETTLELYELQDIMYFKKLFKKIEW